MPGATGGSAQPARPPAPDGLFDGVFGEPSPAVVARGGAARRGDPAGALRDPWDASTEGDRAAEAAAGGATDQRCAEPSQAPCLASSVGRSLRECVPFQAQCGFMHAVCQGMPLWLCASAGRCIPFSL